MLLISIVTYEQQRYVKASDRCFYMKIMNYDKCSKILSTSCLLNRPRQMGQTQIRLLLQKQSDQGLPRLLQMYSDKYFVNPSPDNQRFI